MPRVVPPLLQGRDGSSRPAPGLDTGDERHVVRKLSFTSSGERETGHKRKAAASPSSTDDDDSGSGGASRDSRGTEVSSASVFRWAATAASDAPAIAHLASAAALWVAAGHREESDDHSCSMAMVLTCWRHLQGIGLAGRPCVGGAGHAQPAAAVRLAGRGLRHQRLAI